MIRLDAAEVLLKDEAQTYDAALGKDVPSGEVDPYSRSFTCAWTERMEDVYNAEPIWRDMHNIFRHFAIARIMRDVDVFRIANFDTEFLFNKYEIPNVEVPATMPGSVRVVTARRAGNTGTYSRTVCGGVDVGFNKPLETASDVGGQVQAVGSTVLLSRPNQTALAWAVPAPTPGARYEPTVPEERPAPSEKVKGPLLKDILKDPAPSSAPPPGKPNSLKDLFKG